MSVRYYGDIDIGETRTLGSFSLSKNEILAFAKRYDPLPFHTDEAAATDSMFGGLIASGWQTAANCQRKVSDGFLSETACEGGRAVEHLQFFEPVRPGDVVDVGMEIIDKYPGSDPERGVVKTRVAARSGGSTVAEMVILPIVRKREA